MLHTALHRLRAAGAPMTLLTMTEIPLVKSRNSRAKNWHLHVRESVNAGWHRGECAAGHDLYGRIDVEIQTLTWEQIAEQQIEICPSRCATYGRGRFYTDLMLNIGKWLGWLEQASDDQNWVRAQHCLGLLRAAAGKAQQQLGGSFEQPGEELITWLHRHTRATADQVIAGLNRTGRHDLLRHAAAAEVILDRAWLAEHRVPWFAATKAFAMWQEDLHTRTATDADDTVERFLGYEQVPDPAVAAAELISEWNRQIDVHPGQHQPATCAVLGPALEQFEAARYGSLGWRAAAAAVLPTVTMENLTATLMPPLVADRIRWADFEETRAPRPPGQNQRPVIVDDVDPGTFTATAETAAALWEPDTREGRQRGSLTEIWQLAAGMCAG